MKKFIKAYNSFTQNKGMLDRNDVVGSLLFFFSDMSTYVNGQNFITDDSWVL